MIAAPYIPPAHEPDALLNMAAVQALTSHGPSHIHDMVREGAFPAPAIREHRCTRWRNADVRAWLRERIERSMRDPANGAGVIAQAKRASDAAQRKRTAAAA